MTRMEITASDVTNYIKYAQVVIENGKLVLSFEDGTSAQIKLNTIEGSIDENGSYAEGYLAGLAEGDAAGYERGYSAGYSEGRTAGYSEGYTDGYSSAYSSPSSTQNYTLFASGGTGNISVNGYPVGDGGDWQTSIYGSTSFSVGNETGSVNFYVSSNSGE